MLCTCMFVCWGVCVDMLYFEIMNIYVFDLIFGRWCPSVSLHREADIQDGTIIWYPADSVSL